ncbi:hypothetical protein C8T65DRAFT_781357 [Cerioporus squamosus]|nr:hypothetical protein C8T65DRAFT_781357 [Cerioporus squamosus]
MSSTQQTHIVEDAAVASRAIVWSDILESTLFAQSAADKQQMPTTEKETLAWYKKYTDTLGTVGWIVSNASFTEVQYKGTEGVVHDTVLQHLANDPTVSKALYTSVSKALLAFSHAGSGSEAKKVFDSCSIASTSNFASFQLVVVSVDENGDVILTLFAWFYTANQTIGDTLWYSWKNATLGIKTSTMSMTLNTGLYEQVRSTIHDKLGSANKFDLLVALCRSSASRVQPLS